MPTDNPKVSGYVPQVVYERLIEFKDERGISISQAITIVLAEFFAIEIEVDASAVVGGVTLARLEALEAQLDELRGLVLTNSTDAGQVEEVEHQGEPVSEPLRLNQSALARYLGLDPSTLSGQKKRKSAEDLSDYLQSKDPDGYRWKFILKDNIYEREETLNSSLQGGLPLD